MNLSSRISLLLACLVVVSAGIASGIIYWRFDDQLVTAKLNDLERETEMQATRFVVQIDELIRDTRFLAHTPAAQGLTRGLANGGVDWEDESQIIWQRRMGELFEQLLLNKPNYLQLRYIGVADEGLELVRVDRSGTNGATRVVPRVELQRKGSTPYFLNTIEADPDETFLSPINLNKERGEIQIPHVPVIRASIPIFGSGGEIFGMIVVNFSMKAALQDLGTVSNSTHTYFITNGMDSYLDHPDPAREFGFELGAADSAESDFPLLAGLQSTGNAAASEILEEREMVVSARRTNYGTQTSDHAIEIIVTDSFEDVTTVSRTVFRQISLMILFLVVAAAGVGVWMGRLLTRPVTRLRDSVQDLDLEVLEWQEPEGLSGEARDLGGALRTVFTRLKRQTSELAATNRELSQFAYVASHDLQEPVRTITSFTELVANEYGDRFDDRGQQYLTFITSSCERMRILIHGLLEYCRLGSRSEPERVNLKTLLETIGEDLTVTVESTETTLTIHEMPSLLLYPVETRVLFQNLVSNAIKYVAEGTKPIVEIRSRQAADGWIFTVDDNGIGIRPEHRERIFQMFQRLHGIGEYDGSGIGLANCLKVAELHGGSIWVEDSSHGGARFCVRLQEVQL